MCENVLELIVWFGNFLLLLLLLLLLLAREFEDEKWNGLWKLAALAARCLGCQ